MDTCPMCGQKVKISRSSEGTGCYIPLEMENTIREVLAVVESKYKEYDQRIKDICDSSSGVQGQLEEGRFCATEIKRSVRGLQMPIMKLSESKSVQVLLAENQRLKEEIKKIKSKLEAGTKNIPFPDLSEEEQQNVDFVRVFAMTRQVIYEIEQTIKAGESILNESH